LKAIKELHELGYISRDVKPANFVTGPRKSDDYRNVFMIDFGLCKKYKDKVSFRLYINVALSRSSSKTTFFHLGAKLAGVAPTDMPHCKRIADKTCQEGTTSKVGTTCWWK
jgi:serine/threonine protein kinase